MDIKFKTKEIARKFIETIKHNYDNANLECGFRSKIVI